MLASARCMVCTSRKRLSPEKLHNTRRPSSSNSGETFQNSPPTFHSPMRLTSWRLDAGNFQLRRDRIGFARADDVLVGGVARDAVAEILVAVKAGAIDRNDRRSELGLGRLGHREYRRLGRRERRCCR